MRVPGAVARTGRRAARWRDYLEAYAARFEPARPERTRVDRVDARRRRRGFVVSTAGRPPPRRPPGHRRDRCRSARRSVPAFAGELDPSIRQLHSHEYRNPAQLADGPVLVVGLSPLRRRHRVRGRGGHRTILVRQVPRPDADQGHRHEASPCSAGRSSSFVVRARPHDPHADRPRSAAPTSARAAARSLRVRLHDLDRAGVERHDAKTVGAPDGRPVLADGTVLDVANVIWATGYRPDYTLDRRRRSSATTAGRSRNAASARRCPACTSSASRSSTPSRRCSSTARRPRREVRRRTGRGEGGGGVTPARGRDRSRLTRKSAILVHLAHGSCFDVHPMNLSDIEAADGLGGAHPRHQNRTRLAELFI